MLGDTYTIVDMNVWGWARMLPNVMGEGAWDKYKNLKRLVDEINARPAAQKAGSSRTVTSSRPRWTRKRSTPCSRT